MTAAVLLSPHNDDETLFAAFLALQHRAHVIVVLRSQVQEQRYGISSELREVETESAIAELGLTWEQWPYPDTEPGWAAIADRVAHTATEFDTVIAPAFEALGHEQHNAVSALAEKWPRGRRVCYLTYQRARGRSRHGRRVEPEPEWIAAKHRALASYRSQMRPETGCQEWFLGDLNEYVAT